MTTYVDTSALLKLYVEEPDSDVAHSILLADPTLVTSWITLVEARRNLARLLDGVPLRRAREACETDLDRMALLTPTERICRAAAEIAEHLSVRSLDALHLAAAQSLGGDLRGGRSAKGHSRARPVFAQRRRRYRWKLR